MGDGPDTIDPVIISSCVILEDETSETQVDGIVTKVRETTQPYLFSNAADDLSFLLAKINSLKNRLERIKQVVLHDNSQLYESIPSPDGIDIKKLGQNGLIMTDSCNAAQKARCLLQYEIGGMVCKFDCHHHLCNVWIKGLEKSVSVFLRVVVSDSLEQIPPELRVTCIFLAIARTWDKFFSLCINYPKGQGEPLRHG